MGSPEPARGVPRTEEVVIVPRKLRFALLVARRVVVAVPAATARAVARMPVGFYDDPSFRWSPASAAESRRGGRGARLDRARARQLGRRPRRPSPRTRSTATTPPTASPTSTRSSPQAQKYDLQVLLTITGTPSWANGGQTPNHPPTNLNVPDPVRPDARDPLQRVARGQGRRDACSRSGTSRTWASS